MRLRYAYLGGGVFIIMISHFIISHNVGACCCGGSCFLRYSTGVVCCRSLCECCRWSVLPFPGLILLLELEAPVDNVWAGSLDTIGQRTAESRHAFDFRNAYLVYLFVLGYRPVVRLLREILFKRHSLQYSIMPL